MTKQELLLYTLKLEVEAVKQALEDRTHAVDILLGQLCQTAEELTKELPDRRNSGDI